MNVLVAGSTEFIGPALIPFLSKEGHTVTRLIRKKPTSGDPQVRWDPEAGTIDSDGLTGMHAVVHLAEENLNAGR